MKSDRLCSCKEELELNRRPETELVLVLEEHGHDGSSAELQIEIVSECAIVVVLLVSRDYRGSGIFSVLRLRRIEYDCL